MRDAISLLLGVLAAAACGAPELPPADRASRRAVRPAPPVVAPAPGVTRCVATPSTVYGDEVVTFQLEGEGASAQFEVVDQAQKSVFRGSSPVPAALRAPGVPSGDFTLRIGRSSVSCRVTVNRELSRATSAGR